MRIACRVFGGMLLLLIHGQVVRADHDKATPPEEVISFSDALERANKAAAALGYDLSTVNAWADDRNSLWIDHVASGPFFELNPELQRRLEKTSYWAVYYEPIDSKHIDGDLWIFIDSKTGELMTTYPLLSQTHPSTPERKSTVTPESRRAAKSHPTLEELSAAEQASQPQADSSGVTSTLLVAKPSPRPSPNPSPSVSNDVKLPELGRYSEKLVALKDSLTRAIDALAQRQLASSNDVKGGPHLKGEPSLERSPYYLLRKMRRNLETDERGSLIDMAGFDKFFVRLKALKAYHHPAVSEVVQRAGELSGFSYLFPPDPAKPLLIMIPGAGGEPLSQCQVNLLQDEAKHFTIIGYAFDATVPYSEMVDTLLTDFTQRHLGAQEHLVVTMSLGNTLLHSAILKTVEAHQETFSNSYVVSAGLLPGGSAKFLGKPAFIPALTAAVFPPYAEIFTLMNPQNPAQSAIATHMPQIQQATKGIFYVQARNDPHINLGSEQPVYAANRDLVLGAMEGRVMTVSPPDILEKNNPHLNILFAPEVETLIDGYAERFSSGGHAVSPGASHVVRKSLMSQPQGGGGMPEIANAFLKDAVPDERAWVVEVLEDSLALEGSDRGAQAAWVRDYLAMTQAPWTFDELVHDATVALDATASETRASSGSPNLPADVLTGSSTPPVSPQGQPAGPTGQGTQKATSGIERKLNVTPADRRAAANASNVGSAAGGPQGTTKATNTTSTPNPSPSPAPSASPTPANPTPTPEPTPTSEPSPEPTPTSEVVYDPYVTNPEILKIFEELWQKSFPLTASPRNNTDRHAGWWMSPAYREEMSKRYEQGGYVKERPDGTYFLEPWTPGTYREVWKDGRRVETGWKMGGFHSKDDANGIVRFHVHTHPTVAAPPDPWDIAGTVDEGRPSYVIDQWKIYRVDPADGRVSVVAKRKAREWVPVRSLSRPSLEPLRHNP